MRLRCRFNLFSDRPQRDCLKSCSSTVPARNQTGVRRLERSKQQRFGLYEGYAFVPPRLFRQSQK
jgi:hypothetical protein